MCIKGLMFCDGQDKCYVVICIHGDEVCKYMEAIRVCCSL